MKTGLAMLATLLAVGFLLAADDPKSEAKGEDEKAIRAQLAALEKEWNAHDMKAFSARLAEDVDVVNRFGQWMKGRMAVEKHLIALHAMPFRDHLVGRSSRIEQVRFLAPDLALAHEVTEEETGKSVRTYLLQKRDGTWWIQSANIVDQKAQPAG
jgi:uncharacterized protein (TIGR02246 family)